MRITFLGLFCILMLTQLINCQVNDDDDGGGGGGGGDGRSFEGDVEESVNDNGKADPSADDKKKQTEAKLKEQEDLRPKSHFTEERFSQLFVPRNSRRKLVSPRFTTRPKPTLPSFIKKPVSVPPPDFETSAPRLASATSSTRAPASRTTSTTSRPSRGRNRSSSSNRFDDASSTTSTTEAYRRSVFSTRKPSSRLFPNRNRN